MEQKKKLLYIMRYRIDESFNLKTKFDGQLNAFKALGFDVSFIAFDKNNFYLVSDGLVQPIGKTNFKFKGYLHTLFYYDLHRAVIKLLKCEKWDIVYWRSAPCWISSCKVARTVKKTGGRLIYEFPTYPRTKEKQNGFLRKAYLRYSDLLQKYIDKKTDLFVMIGDDAGGKYNGKPAVNITNGIDVASVKLRERQPDPEKIHILALASMCFWHGYDRLIISLSEYDGEHPVVIHMVGGNDGGSLPEWKELACSLGLENSVIFHGPMSGTELEKMFDICDVGVNSLGMYRKGFELTAELKTREYSSRGLPFVCSVDDPALANAEDVMWHKVENNDSIPDMKKIVEFAMRMRSEPDCAEKLRSYAEKYMTWEAQYKIVFDTLDGINL